MIHGTLTRLQRAHAGQQGGAGQPDNHPEKSLKSIGLVTLLADCIPSTIRKKNEKWKNPFGNFGHCHHSGRCLCFCQTFCWCFRGVWIRRLYSHALCLRFNFSLDLQQKREKENRRVHIGFIHSRLHLATLLPSRWLWGTDLFGHGHTRCIAPVFDRWIGWLCDI